VQVRAGRVYIRTLVLIAIVLQHFQVAIVAGFSVTLGLVVGVPVLMYLTKLRLDRPAVIVILLVSAYCGLVAIMNPGNTTDIWNFSTTFCLLVLAMVVMLLGTQRMGSESLEDVKVAMRIALLVIVAYSVAQVVSGSLGSEALFNPFGDHQFRYQYHPYLADNPIPRAQGFFLEPSYDAFVIGSLSVALLALGAPMLSTVGLCVVGMGATRSATGMLLIVVVLIALALRNRIRVALPLIATLGVFVLAFLPYLEMRLSSTGDTGSSANYRLLAPLPMLGDIVQQSPLGFTLGSIYDVVPRFHLTMVGAEQTISLDNGDYVIVYYFGVVGVLFLVGAASYAIREAFFNHSTPARVAIVPIWIFGSLLFSGGIVAPEFALMTFLVIASGNANAGEEIANAC